MSHRLDRIEMMNPAINRVMRNEQLRRFLSIWHRKGTGALRCYRLVPDLTAALNVISQQSRPSELVRKKYFDDSRYFRVVAGRW